MALSQKVFHFGSNLTKNLLDHYPDHLLFMWIVLRIVIWHLFWKIGAKKLKKNPEIKPPLFFKNQDALSGHDLSSFTKFRIYYETKLPVLILNQQSGTAV